MTAEDKCMQWARLQTRPTGLRVTHDGVRVVCRLDTMGGLYVSRYGLPVEPRQFDPDVVLASGPTWEAVASSLGIA